MTEYKEALGIATGDIVTTSYNSGPYRVESIWGPKPYQLGRRSRHPRQAR